jgi:hypothetical protein
LNNHASVAGQHAFKRCQGSIDVTEVSHVGDAVVLGRCHFAGGRKDRDHRIVDPDIDRPECVFDRGCGSLNLLGVRDIGGNHQRLTAKGLDILASCIESVPSTSD